jgi:hypothetical protein
MLAPGGAFATMFVASAEARRDTESGRTGFSFRHTTPNGKLSAEKLDSPTYAVGIPSNR